MKSASPHIERGGGVHIGADDGVDKLIELTDKLDLILLAEQSLTYGSTG